MKNITKILFISLIMVSSNLFAQLHDTTATTQTGARTARSSTTAKPVAVAPTTTAAPTSSRSARSAIATTPASTVRETVKQARTTTTSARATRSGRGSLPANSVRAINMQPISQSSTVSTTDQQGEVQQLPADDSRSAVSRAGISVITPAAKTTETVVTTTATTTTTPTSMAEALKKAGITSKTTTTISKEELAVKISDEQTCRTEYNKCMDQFCNDTTEDSIMGRCLCSGSISSYKTKEDERVHLLASINQLTAQILYLPLAQKKATLEGKDFNVALKEVMSEEFKKQGLETTKTDSAEIDIYEVYLGEVSNSTVRQEGNALLKSAQKNCTNILELCPASSKVVQSSYATLVGNACRTYEKEITAKLQELTVVQQNAYNKYQIESSNYDIESSNKYDSQECSTQLYTCMSKDSICGSDFKKCYNETILKSFRVSCQSILNQCRAANMPVITNEKKRTEAQTDVIWKSFVHNALSQGQLTNADCFDELSTCMAKDTVCGEGYSQCYNKSLLITRKTFCTDILERCKDTQSAVWEAFVKTALTRSQLSAAQCYKESKTCVITECGTDFGKCLSAGTKAVKGDTQFLSDIQDRAKTACSDIVSRCANTYSQTVTDGADQTADDYDTWGKSATEVQNAIWTDIINQMIDDNVNDLSDSEAYNQLTTCMQTACGGADFKDCRNRTLLDSKKFSCITQLNRSAQPEVLYNSFAKATLNKYGYKDADCIATIEASLKANCGEGYIGCNTHDIAQFKYTTTTEASEMCEWDSEQNEFYIAEDGTQLDKTNTNLPRAKKYATGAPIERVVISLLDSDKGTSQLDPQWDPIANTVSKIGDETVFAACKAKGDMYDFDNKNYLCICKYGMKDNGTCRTKTEYDEVMAGLGKEVIAQSKTACENVGGVWTDSCKFKVSSLGYEVTGLFKNTQNWAVKQKWFNPGVSVVCTKSTFGWATQKGCLFSSNQQTFSKRITSTGSVLGAITSGVKFVLFSVLGDFNAALKKNFNFETWSAWFENGKTYKLPTPTTYHIVGEAVVEKTPADVGGLQ